LTALLDSLGSLLSSLPLSESFAHCRMYYFGRNASNQSLKGSFVHSNGYFRQIAPRRQIGRISPGSAQMNAIREELAKVEAGRLRIQKENSGLEEKLRNRKEKEEMRRLREKLHAEKRKKEAAEQKNQSLRAEIADTRIGDMRETVEDGSSSSKAARSSSSGASSVCEDEYELEYEELTVVVSPKRKRKRKLVPISRRTRASKRKRDEENASIVDEPPRKMLKFSKVSRPCFGKRSMAVLIDYWDSHLDLPFPKGQDKADLARKAELTPLQVYDCMKTFFLLLVYGCLDRVL